MMKEQVAIKLTGFAVGQADPTGLVDLDLVGAGRGNALVPLEFVSDILRNREIDFVNVPLPCIIDAAKLECRDLALKVDFASFDHTGGFFMNEVGVTCEEVFFELADTKHR
jgi:hypothetical protein